MNECPKCSRQFVDDQSECPMDGAELDTAVGTLPDGVGQMVGNYKLIAHLAKGGMGQVFIARHVKLKRYAAIKRLHSRLAKKTNHVAKFFTEARTVNKISHAHIVDVIDLVDDPKVGAYCVLELLNGIDLAALLSRGPVDAAVAVDIAAQIADALGAVHGVNIVHRDLKPRNVVLIKRGGIKHFVKLIDFGVAQMSDDEATGVPAGTAAYMAPEQGAGERVDGRADIYSLGVVLYKMVTGKHPFPSETDTEYLLRHADVSAPSPRDNMPQGVMLSRTLDRLILRCLAKERDERHPSADALAIALRAIDVDDDSAGFPIRRVAVAGLLAAAAAVLFVMMRGEPSATKSQRPTVAQASTAAAPSAAVVLSFSSKPPGAVVVRDGESIPLGITPFEMTLARAGGDTSVEFRLDGYEPTTVDVSLAESADVSVLLTELPEPKLEPKLEAKPEAAVAVKATVAARPIRSGNRSVRAPAAVSRNTIKKTRADRVPTSKKERDAVVDPFAD